MSLELAHGGKLVHEGKKSTKSKRTKSKRKYWCLAVDPLQELPKFKKKNLLCCAPGIKEFNCSTNVLLLQARLPRGGQWRKHWAQPPPSTWIIVIFMGYTRKKNMNTSWIICYMTKHKYIYLSKWLIKIRCWSRTLVHSFVFIWYEWGHRKINTVLYQT